MDLDVLTVLEGVDVDAVRRLVKGTFMEKYSQPNGHIRKAIRLARQLGLDDGVQRHIIDVGSGVGWFVRVAMILGHSAFGIEQPGYMHGKLAKLLQVPMVEHKVTAAHPLPDIGPEFFDLITMVSFNTHGDRELLAALNKAIHQIVTPGGRLYISPNEAEVHTTSSRFWPGWNVVETGGRHIILEKPEG
jgi:SAM-dependent methyltransferase